MNIIKKKKRSEIKGNKKRKKEKKDKEKSPRKEDSVIKKRLMSRKEESISLSSGNLRSKEILEKVLNKYIIWLKITRKRKIKALLIF